MLDNKDRSLIGLVSIAVPKGAYNIVVEGRDFNNENVKKTLSDKISVVPFPSEPSISDIELAANILKDPSDINSIFYKKRSTASTTDYTNVEHRNNSELNTYNRRSPYRTQTPIPRRLNQLAKASGPN